MIERSGAPFCNRVATGAIFILPAGHELASVDILMTLEALFRSVRKIRTRAGFVFRRCSGRLVRPMATGAGCFFVRALKREGRGRMIERANLSPLPRVMAGFARQGSLFRAELVCA